MDPAHRTPGAAETAPADTTAARTYRHVVDEETITRMGRALMRQYHAWLVIPTGLALVLVGTVLAPWLSGTMLLATLAVGSIIAVAPFFWSMNLRRELRRVTPIGSVLETAFTDDEFSMTGPLGRSTVPLDVIGDPLVRSGVVLFRMGGTKALSIHSVEVFPADELSRLRYRSGTT